MYTHMYVYVYIMGGCSASNRLVPILPVSVKKTFLLRKPLPCSPAAEIAIQPLIWSFES